MAFFCGFFEIMHVEARGKAALNFRSPAQSEEESRLLQGLKCFGNCDRANGHVFHFCGIANGHVFHFSPKAAPATARHSGRPGFFENFHACFSEKGKRFSLKPV